MTEEQSQNGYTLIELILVLVIIGIITTVGLNSLTEVNQTNRFEETRFEMDRLAAAIVGDPSLVSGGVRTDFGYVGDVGSLPLNLNALTTNPGGYATWSGPYYGDEFSTDGSSASFKLDAWGRAYTYSGGTTITSTGGATTLTRNLAINTDDLLNNNVTVVVYDLDHTPPGATYRDSVRVVLSYPNGGGSVTNSSVTPRSDGSAFFDSIPIGIHLVRIVYVPTADTLQRKIVVNVGQDSYAEISLADTLWSGN
ncbi:MAG: prepilin-type N-terminal cleavage/methylation domain-containing protein [candidate division Zixibacteria bacterium]|nr:prepilin-type N-terminal cleavage/methylation domain-containing protein [candidate division Zixibacteria bacterium]